MNDELPPQEHQKAQEPRILMPNITLESLQSRQGVGTPQSEVLDKEYSPEGWQFVPHQEAPRVQPTGDVIILPAGEAYYAERHSQGSE
jgi:hypothetical protein